MTPSREAQVGPWLESVDTFRVLAIAGVVAIHTTPVLDITARSGGVFALSIVLINQAARFAVPFFFTMSGYFWGLKVRAGADVRVTSLRIMSRLLLLYVIWSLIYLLPYQLSAAAQSGILGPLRLSYWNALRLVAHPELLLFEGTHVHLWFLMALMWAIALTGVFVASGRVVSLVVLAVALYVFGTLAYAYSATPFGVSIPFVTRDGPFFGTVFFVTGYGLSALAPRREWLGWGALLLAGGFVLELAEDFGLWRLYHVYPLNEYVFGTYFMGLGTAVMALSDHPLGRWRALARLGPATLGIYLVNPAFAELLEPIGNGDRGAMWLLSHLAAVLTLSVVAVVLMSRSRYLRTLVVQPRHAAAPGFRVQ